jgi:hypothetical protein
MTRPTTPGPSGNQGTKYRNGTGQSAAADDGNPGPNHATHLQPGLRVFMSAHPVLTAIAAVGGLVLSLTNWEAFLLLLSLAGVATGLAMLGMLAIDVRRRRRQEKAAIVARADDQHEALLHGDDQWGVFGIRPPTDRAVQPHPKLREWARPPFVACVVIVTGLLYYAVTATMHARSTDQAPRPVAAPTVPMPAPANQPIPHPMNPPAPQHIPSPLPVPPSPSPQLAAPVRLGQKAVDGNVTFVVTSVERSKTVTNPSLTFMQTTAKGTFWTIELTITNNGNQLTEFIASYQRLKIDDAVYVPDPAAAVWTLTFETMVGPGTTATATLSFDVPTATPPGGILELHRSSSSPGAHIELLPPQ